MTVKQKYMFETAFDQPGGGKGAPPMPTHTDEDLESAREEAFHAGHEAALVEARQIEELRIKELFETMAQQIDALSGTRAAENDRIAGQATDVALAICRKVLPEMARRHALTEIESLISNCLAEMPEEPRIVVRVADQKVDQLQTRIGNFSKGFDGKLVLLGDDEIADTDCAVVWADGGTERNLDRLWQDIDTAIGRLHLSPGSADIVPDAGLAGTGVQDAIPASNEHPAEPAPSPTSEPISEPTAEPVADSTAAPVMEETDAPSPAGTLNENTPGTAAVDQADPMADDRDDAATAAT